MPNTIFLKSVCAVLSEHRSEYVSPPNDFGIMNFVCLFVILIANSMVMLCNGERNIVRDYFAFRKVQRIVGFSCGDVESNIDLVRRFNNIYFTYISISENVSESQIDVKQLLKAEYHQVGIFLDSRCDPKRSSKILEEASENSMYDEMHKWLILGSNLSQSLNLLNDEEFSISTDVIIAISSSMKNYTLYDVYNPCKDRGGSMNVTLFGTWNSEKGLIVTLTQSKFERRSNLHGMTLKLGIVITFKQENMSLHDMMMEYSMKVKHGRSKFLYVILTHLSHIFNFTTEIVQINAQRRFDNAGPVFTAFKRKLIDLSASPVAMRTERLDNGDIIGPVWPIRSCFLFRTISSTKVRPDQFLKPLSVKVWYAIGSMIIIAATVLIILIRMEGVRGPMEIYGLSVLLTIGSLSQQGSAFVPIRFAGRIAFLHILVFSVLILNYYSASVVSDRLKNKGQKMNDSLIDLTDSGMKLAVESTPYIRSFLQVPDKEVRYFYQHRWTKIPEYDRYMPLEEGLDRVAEGTLAYHTMIDSAYPYIGHSFNDRSICELTEVHLFRSILAFYARHKSPFTELLKVGLIKIRNVGIQKRELKRWSARKPFCPSNLLIAEPLSIYEAVPIFVFFGLSIGTALLVCILENIFHCFSSIRFPHVMLKKHLIERNLNLQPPRINLQSLKKFKIFEDWISSQNP